MKNKRKKKRQENNINDNNLKKIYKILCSTTMTVVGIESENSHYCLTRGND